MKKIRKSGLKVSIGLSGSNEELSADIDGVTRVDKLVLVDQKDFKEWELSIRNGIITIEPFDIVEKREFKIDKIIYE